MFDPNPLALTYHLKDLERQIQRQRRGKAPAGPQASKRAGNRDRTASGPMRRRVLADVLAPALRRMAALIL